MTTETVTEDFDNEDVPEQFLTKETFSFFEVLSEIAYPTDEVTLYMNENAARKFQKLAAELDDPETTAERTEAIYPEIQKVSQEVRDSAYVFHLRGVSDDRLTDVKTLADKEFKDKRKQRKVASGGLESYLPESEQMAYAKYFSAVLISLHVEQVVESRTGRIMTAPDANEIAFLMDKAPTHEKGKLHTAIESLKVSASEFERSIDEGFLAKP